jgi:dTDP-4-dehydrorhamnose reductase
MRIAVTGSKGQLGAALVEQGRALGHEIIALDRASCNLEVPTEIGRVFRGASPELIFHCAAMTGVDDCEREREKAWLVNALATRAVAQVAQRHAPMVTVSTDYVFDGENPEGYDELSPVNPQSVYGLSKRAGEEAVLAAAPENLVIRTSWVFAPRGQNFFRAILRRAEQGEPLRVVKDQIGRPTYAPQLAAAMLQLASRESWDGIGGLLHWTNGGEAVSWHALACAAVDAAGFKVPVSAISSAEWKAPAPRPACSILRSLSREAFGLPPPPDWKIGLAEYIAQEGWK